MTWVINCLRWYYSTVYPRRFTNVAARRDRRKYLTAMFFKRSFIFGTLRFLLESYLIICLLFYLGKWWIDVGKSYDGLIKRLLKEVLLFLDGLNIILPIFKFWGQLLFVIGVIAFFPSIRNLFVSALKLFKVLPGKDTTALFLRYVQIGRFSRYFEQSDIYSKLIKQYPPDTHFVVLP
ncbi:MAG: hypothetical protein HKO54_04570, partial [Flavobacteriaceae bacterium]|nr:hypothetical protein [Flavobacteriaceae bacterium]